MSEDKQNLRTAYEEVCRLHDGIADFRAKLLALLPLASGAGIFLLVAGDRRPEPAHLPAIGVLGVLVTLALFIFELRGIQRCKGLRDCGKQLECKLLGNAHGLGAFTDEPAPALGFVRNTAASNLIYSAVGAAWAYVATSGDSGFFSCAQASSSARVVFIVFIVFSAFGVIVSSDFARKVAKWLSDAVSQHVGRENKGGPAKQEIPVGNTAKEDTEPSL